MKSTIPTCICDADFELAVASVCLDRGFALEKDTAQASICCNEGCSYSVLSVFSNPLPKPNRQRYILCDSVYYNALNSLCNDGYDQIKHPTFALNCCTKVCSLFELGHVCKGQWVFSREVL
ncbi:uncharacterized protein LOC117179535 isoform X6 [Belonocnema kinseyi]|uniref:uncharacterized protein LOC117179535 isoform X6 n=1 Tax=Belonocnema kinseyi TaxID=2817044 RepID=UPI00143D2F2F|nr:uncharacterized protein LOC117179535 isoform X6 [Belonocnema kinseyi]